MDTAKSKLKHRKRKFTQDVILDAAEQLIRDRRGGNFSMRALAEAAGVGFTTPFNHFGSKNAIVLSLAHRVIARVEERFSALRVTGDAIDRIFEMSKVGMMVILEEPDISRQVISALGVLDSSNGHVRARSQKLWQIAIGEGEGILPKFRPLAKSMLADQLALSFRGCLSFWISGEIKETDLLTAMNSAAALLLMGIVEERWVNKFEEQLNDAISFLHDPAII